MNNRFTQAASLSLKQLSYLLAVAETLNFTRAAELCFVTQSTLSGGLAELERQLDVTLVERDRQRVALTPIGLEVARRARELLAAGQDLLNIASQASDPARGELTLGVIPTIAPFLLSRILETLRTRFPLLQVNIRESQTHVLLAELDRGELDAAVLALPIDTGKLHAEVLYDEPLQLVAHADDQMALHATFSLENLDSGKLLLLEKGHCLRDHTLAACTTRTNSDDNHAIEATNLSTMVQLVNAGLGCALLPEMAVQAGILTGTSTTVVPLQAPLPTRTIALLTRASHPKFDFMIQQLAVELKRCRCAA
ncbi:hydrogen peroxide-inducible genes activator [Limnobacter humi]|uniref:Hydrogen peroxide-inducible genes activator n=1 Tax=Limnobacter humi TaxID=1778671 RepID=A0ABT1WE09_9BURK|nr:hydrogen peroxide-inducible genes activator [Limnobacter humi]MCQ8895753.1 hydrogen peroxide-inducible genes activator [Limnobacter humi]